MKTLPCECLDLFRFSVSRLRLTTVGLESNKICECLSRLVWLRLGGCHLTGALTSDRASHTP